MKLLLFILIPPLIGAFIGFITNVIAIKMLFRPLREYRVFGIRVPLTPGILPKQRHKLAESIGAMVERELLTPELLRQRLSQDDVRGKFRESISIFTGKILELPVQALLADNANAEADALVSSLKGSVSQSPLLRTVTRNIIQRICTEAENRYPQAAVAVTDFLRVSEMRRNLEIQGQSLITEVLLGMSAFQRLIVSAGQYEKNLRDKMPEIIDNLINKADDFLKNEGTRARILVFFNSFITKNAAKLPGGMLPSIRDAILREHYDVPLGTLLAIDAETRQRLDGFLCSRLLKLVDDEIDNLLKSINVKEMVTERIDSLDMIRVERIILDVMANQLKWINLFGGILGFLIGISQVLVNIIMR